MERPDAGRLRLDDHVPALARVDAQGVAGELGATERPAVAFDDPHRHPVEMPRVHHDSLVHEPDPDALADRGEDRHNGREAVAVDREPAELIVRDPHVLAVVLDRIGRRVDEERPEEPTTDLVRRVVVRVVHQRARVDRRELVGVRLARDDRLLGHERHAVHEEVLELDAVEVDARRLLEVVGELRPNLVALVHPDGRARPLAVVAETGDRVALLVDPLLDLVDGELEDLDVAVELRGERRQGVAEEELRAPGRRPAWPRARGSRPRRRGSRRAW